MLYGYPSEIILLFAVATKPFDGLYEWGSSLTGMKPFHSYPPTPGTGRRPVQFFRIGDKPTEYSPMLPCLSAYTIFSEGTFHRFIASENCPQFSARSTTSEDRYPAVPGSMPTQRSAKARLWSCHKTGPCRVNFKSTVT